MATTPATASGPLRIRLLGELELRRGDALLPLPPSRRTRALLGYLVATGTPQSRTALCDLLWDGPDDPRASLRWSLTKLRAVVDEAGAPRLVADRERVGFQASFCVVDTRCVDALLAGGIESAPLAALEEAAEHLRGEFLDGLDLPGCYRFHHWCMAERERSGRQRREVLRTLVARLADDPVRALPHGHAMVAADPLAEAPHATLVRLLAAAGRYPEAERHHAWARALLRREISLPPDGVLDEAIRRVRREQRDAGAEPPADAPPAAASALSPAPPQPQAAVGAPSAMPALAGRALERQAIALALAGQMPARLLLFAGEPGIGKTRMLDHLAESAAGHRLMRGRCFEAETVRPYGLWLEALRSVPTEGVPADVLAQVAPLVAGHPGAEGGNRERLFDAAAALLRSLAAQQPIVVLVDDLQWIDEGSAALLHFVMRTLAGTPVCFVAAARAGELDDNTSAKGLLQSLAREGGVLRLDLRPLDRAEARTLLGAAPLEVDEALRLTGGNPLYLAELARAAAQGALDSLAPHDGDRALARLIELRLGALDDAARELLAWAAAFGGELRPDLLADAAGWSVAEVLARLERMARRGLVAPTGQGHFDFAHGLVRQAVYRALSQPQRRAIHRRIAHALAAASADEPWLHGDIVHHAGLAGDGPAAARACLAAGEHCLRVYANGQAAAVAERGLAQLAELAPGAERVRLEIGLLRLRVAAAAGAGGRPLPALADRIEQATLAAQALALHAEAAAGWEILAFWRQQASDTGRTEAATLAAERMTRRADAGTRCLQLANSGRCLLDIEADPARGRALLEEATALAGELGLEVMEIDWGRGLAARADGDLDAAAAALARAALLARLAGNHWREYECTVWLATVALERRRHAEVLAHVAEIAGAAARMGEAQVPFAQALGAVARLREQDGDALAVLEASLDALRALDDKAHLAYALNEAAALALADGRVQDAAALAAEALVAARAVRRPTEVAVALARLCCAARETGQAREWLAQAPLAGHSARAAAALAEARTQAVRRVPTVAPTGPA